MKSDLRWSLRIILPYRAGGAGKTAFLAADLPRTVEMRGAGR